MYTKQLWGAYIVQWCFPPTHISLHAQIFSLPPHPLIPSSPHPLIPSSQHTCTHFLLVLLLLISTYGCIHPPPSHTHTQIGMGILRLGFITLFLSDSLISGYTAAGSFVIFVTQLRFLFGLNTQAAFVPSGVALTPRVS